MPYRDSFRGSLAFLLAAIFLVANSLSGAEFKMSFLDSKPVLEDTCALLRGNGIPEETISSYIRLVEQYFQFGDPLDRSRLPVPVNGYYSFQGMNDFTNHVPGGLCRLPSKAVSLVCYDVVSLLLAGTGMRASRLGVDYETKRIVRLGDHGETKPVSYEVLVKGERLLWPENGYESLVGKPRSRNESELCLSLRAPRQLAGVRTASKSDLRHVFREQIKALKADGIAFPHQFQVGLAFYVDVKQRYIVGDHAFLCFREGGRVICLEKDGSLGPFVRAEFASDKELGQYIIYSLEGDTKNPQMKEWNNAILVSLNEKLIALVPPPNQ